jgi:hypothetical protein
LLEAVEIPVHAIPGNHDVNDFDGAVSPTEAAAGIGIDLIIEPRAIDVGGLRVIMFDSAVPGLHRGRISVEYRQAVAALLAAHDGPCLVATHHYPQRSPVATFWPPGVPRGQADAFLDAVVAAKTIFSTITVAHELGGTKGILAVCFNEQQQRLLREARYDELLQARQQRKAGQAIKPGLEKYFDKKGHLIAKRVAEAEEFDGISCILR